MSDKLKQAVYILLYDSATDTGDLEPTSGDDFFVETIVRALIEQNEEICPFQNYSCEESCSNYKNCNEDSGYITCNRDKEKIWNEFIEIN